MNSKLKNKIRKKLVTSFWITNPNNQNIEIAKDSKFFDVFVIDNEHSLISTEEIRSIILFLNANRVPVLMRFAKFNFHEIPKYLDFGIDGVIVADVKSYLELKKIKKNIFYRNIGERGVGLGRMNMHGDTFSEYLKNFNKSIVFLPMIESNIKLTEIENIFKDSEVDGCLIGPYDLSMSLNSPGNFNTKDFKNLENFIIKMKKKYKKAAGLHFMNKDISKLNSFKKKGFNFIPILTDTQFFKIGLNQLSKKSV